MSALGLRKYKIDPKLEANITRILNENFSVSLTDSRKLAESILRLSDYYIQNPSAETPWSEKWCQLAYLSYYLPLNEIRARSVVEEGQKRNFFEGLNTFIDFGSGLGSASLNLQKFPNKYYVEQSSTAQTLHRQLGAEGEWQHPKRTQNALAIFSYSLTELKELPSWTSDVEALMILEPATRNDGRILLELRQKLIEQGFAAWAPCTHQQACPLLTHSKTDWCHDRVHFDQPEWLKEIENHLPFKNRTLTVGYLLARKSPAPIMAKAARMTGDLKLEKGKARQMLCRGPEREFLTWMSRDGEPTEISRGTLIQVPSELQQVQNELRVKNWQPALFD